MGKKKLEATQQLQRIAALPYNPYFEEEVKQIRHKYKIPVGSEKVRHWLYIEQQKNPGKLAVPVVPILGELCFVNQLTPDHYIVATENPLERELLLILQRFRLPVEVFSKVLRYVLEDDKKWLGSHSLKPSVACVSDCSKERPQVVVHIIGLTPQTTKKQWEEIWECQVKQEIEAVKKAYEEAYGIAELGRKRATLEAYSEQIKRWAEWYQLVEIQGLPISEALRKWQQDHPEQVDPSKDIDESTVSRAVSEFREIITPTPIQR